MTARESARAIEVTRRWLERFVIGLELCPFAAEPYRLERIGYVTCDEPTLEGIYPAFLATLESLVLADPRETETLLFILTRGLSDFDDYLDGLAIFEQVVGDAGLEGVIQLASFHPDYRFQGEPDDDPANFSNRSPLPMFHLLREDSLTAALASYPQPGSIPERNIRRLRELGLGGIRRMLVRD